MSDKWKEIKGALISAIESKGRAFLEQNASAKEIVLQRAERLAKLGELYLSAKDNAERKAREEDMKFVSQTIENEIVSAAINASIESRNIFKNIVGVVFETFIKSLPAIVGSFR